MPASQFNETVTRTVQVRVAWAVALVTVALVALGVALLPSQEWGLSLEFVSRAVGNSLFILACSVVGLLIVSRRPGNAIGWIYALVAFALAVGEAAGGYASRSLPGAAWVALLPDLMWLVATPLGVALLLLLFPTGRLSGRRWRPVVWAIVVATAAAVVGTALTPGPVEFYPQFQNPLGLAGAGPALEVIVQVAFVVLTAGVFAAAGSLIVRWRRARGVERQQLKWLAYAAAMLVVAQVGASLLPRTLFLVVSMVATLLFPAATGIAVVRYRLYEIDRIINRTLVYGLLTATLGLVYAELVLVLGQLLGQDSSLAVAGATLAVAALFQPARRRIQQGVDRRFNRRRYDAAQTIEVFSTRLRDQIDLDTLSAELLAVVDQTMQPTRVSLWLRPSAHGSSGTPAVRYNPLPGPTEHANRPKRLRGLGWKAGSWHGGLKPWDYRGMVPSQPRERRTGPVFLGTQNPGGGHGA
jgi:hypothetical protein